MQDLNWRDEKLEEEIQNLLDVVVGIRRLKKLFNVTGKHKARGEMRVDFALSHALYRFMTFLKKCLRETLRILRQSCGLLYFKLLQPFQQVVIYYCGGLLI